MADWKNLGRIQGEPGAPGAQGEQGVQGEPGAQGEQGVQGEPGAGLPEGGTAGQIIVKKNSEDYNTQWTDFRNPFMEIPGTLGEGSILTSDATIRPVWSKGGLVPTGGTVGQVLSKVDGTDFNTEWVDPSGGGDIHGIPTGGYSNDVLLKSSSSDYDVSWGSIPLFKSYLSSIQGVTYYLYKFTTVNARWSHFRFLSEGNLSFTSGEYSEQMWIDILSFKGVSYTITHDQTGNITLPEVSFIDSNGATLTTWIYPTLSYKMVYSDSSNIFKLLISYAPSTTATILIQVPDGDVIL